MSAPTFRNGLAEDEAVLGSAQAGDTHVHLCPDCDQLWRCVCADGWTVSYVRCGCKAER